MKWIGLTGGIASGKSIVTRRLRHLGYLVVDADELAKQVVEPQTEGLRQIIDLFGKDYLNLDGSLNRKKLGDYIFRNPSQKEALEKIIHPKVQELVRRLKDQAQKSGAQVAFYDVPLLFEKNMEQQFDATIVICSDEDRQIERLQKRDSLTREQAKLRIANQLPLSQKKQRADFVIENNSTIDSLYQKLTDVLKSIVGINP